MRKAVFLSILVALLTAVAAAQDDTVESEAHFGWHGDEEEGVEPVEEDSPATRRATRAIRDTGGRSTLRARRVPFGARHKR